jgi:diguanylate cyclase (GGDEF)-like protein
VNEKFGHSTGDSILRSFAHRLKSMLRRTDALSRVATDEFMVLLPETRVAEGLQVAETMRANIEGAEFDAGGLMKVSLTFSAGAVTVGPDVETLDALVSLLGPALRISKNYGKNRVTFGNEKQENYQASHYQLQTIIDEFQLSDPFYAVKQPIVEMKTGNICAYELLVRSNTQFNLPDDLFALSRKADMLSLVDRKCFNVCCAVSRTIPARYRVHFNIFPVTLLDLPPAKIIELLPRERPFENYCIEISEQQFVGLPFDIVGPLKELKKEGCLVALDDVGFGYSCLETLVMIAPDIIKIDKKMITGIAFDEGRRRMLERLLCVMSSLEAVIVAEGIESEDDARVVRELGIEQGQGYFYGRPEK